MGCVASVTLLCSDYVGQTKAHIVYTIMVEGIMADCCCNKAEKWGGVSIHRRQQASNHNNHRKRNERQGLLLLGLVVWVMACEQSCHACHNIVDGGARSIAKTRRTTRSTQTDRRCGGLNLSRHRPSPSEHTRTHQNTPEFCILGSCLILYADR